MAKWVNRVVLSSAGTGSTTETYDPNAGTVLSGTGFVPTAGRLLVAIIGGPVTSTTPSGWTLPTGGSAINNAGLYVWYRTAAGSDTLTSTHNGDGTYPTIIEILEFAAGSTFVGSVANSSISNTNPGPTLSGLTGTNLIIGALTLSNAGQTWSWTPGVLDVSISNGTIGRLFEFSTNYLEDSVLASTSMTATRSAGTGTTAEQLLFAVTVASGTNDVFPAVSVAVETRGSVSKANAAGVTLIESTEPLDGWGATTNPKVSPTVDVEAGDILVAFGIGKDSGTSIFPTAPTNSGTPLTWTRKVNQSGGGTSPVAIYTATAVATETITVTLTLTTSTGPWSFRLLQWRGAIGVGASLGNAQAPAAVQPAITLAATGRKSVIISGHSDANAIDASARVWNTVNSSVMAEASYYRLASSYAVMIGYSTDAGNGGSLALGLTGTGAGTHNWANGAIEILAPLTPSPPSTRSFAIPRAARW